MINHPSRFLLLIKVFFLVFLISSCRQEKVHLKEQNPDQQELVLVEDMVGNKVAIPRVINRVVTISDGFIETVMVHFGVRQKIVGLGSRCLQTDFSYDFQVTDGSEIIYESGMNPVRLLYPDMADLPLVASSGLPIHVEQLASLKPDLVIIRTGSCTINSLDDEKHQKAVQLIADLGFPVLILTGPPSFENPSLDLIADEIALLGRVFQKEIKAAALTAFLKESEAMIIERTTGVPEVEKPKMLMLGLSPKAREAGGVGVTKGKDTMEGVFIERFANAKNAYEGFGGRSSSLMLNTEQIYALDPDVIILPTASGYHPPQEIYDMPYYKHLQLLRAVKEKRVYALPWTPCNCAKRVEYPIEMLIIAKAAYPDLFEDIKVHEWVLGFYEKIYGVDRNTALKIRSAQWLDWTVNANF